MNLEMLKKSNRIIYDAVAGSHAYGTNIPTSDKDIRGVFMLPKEEYLGLKSPPEQVGDEKHDTTYYSLKRFFELIQTANPNLIEMLYFPKDCINFCSPVMQKLIDNRDMFISKKAYYTHSSYAYSQIKKCAGQNKMVNHPEMAIKPKKEDFCWIIRRSSLHNISPALYNEEVPFPCRPIPMEKLPFGCDLSKYHVAALEHTSNVYRLYYYGDDAKGVFRGDDMIVCESIPKEDEHLKFEGLLIYNQHEFEKALNEHRKYNDWISNRNENRWIDQEKGLVQYDCKNMMHCMRLLISGENILTKGYPIVRFEGEQRNYLMKIRAGEFKYEELMAEVERRMANLENLYNTSGIPHSVNVGKIEELYRELAEFVAKEERWY